MASERRKDMDVSDAFYVETEKPNIFKRMLMIEKELGVVAKNLEIQATRTSGYKAVSERDVIDAVKPLEALYGVFSYPASRTVIKDEILENVREYKGEQVKTISKFMRIETIYRFVNVDKPEEFVEITSYGDGIDTGDKATGKAMTYADKYALMKAYKISTGDDPDATKSADEGYKVIQSDEPKITHKQAEYIGRLYQSDINDVLKRLGVEDVTQLTMKQASELINDRRR